MTKQCFYEFGGRKYTKTVKSVYAEPSTVRPMRPRSKISTSGDGDLGWSVVSPC
jgi:hypothetical protein